jgi:hypothetical protein
MATLVAAIHAFLAESPRARREGCVIRHKPWSCGRRRAKGNLRQMVIRFGQRGYIVRYRIRPNGLSYSDATASAFGSTQKSGWRGA